MSAEDVRGELERRVCALETEVARLEAKITALSCPNLFWDDGDPESGYCDPWEIVENYDARTPVLVREGKELGTRYYVFAGFDDDDEERKGVFDTAAQAEAFIKAAALARSVGETTTAQVGGT